MNDALLKIIMAVICVLVAMIGGCTMTINHQDNAAIVAMVNKGANPLDASCALKIENTRGVCAIRAAMRN